MSDRADTNPGSQAFSEPETRIVKSLMEEFKPHTFLDVHSGDLGIYLPNNLASEQTKTQDVEAHLSEVDDMACKCPLGIADDEVGYKTSGSSLDYSFDKTGAKLAIAMEIWAKPDMLESRRARWAAQKTKLFQSAGSSFLQDMQLAPPSFLKSAAHSDLLGKTGWDCFDFFNPRDGEMYKKVTHQWSDTLMALSKKGREMPTAISSLQLMQKGAEHEMPWHHILRVAAALLVMVALWFLWQRFSHLFTKNKDAEQQPIAMQTAGPIQVHD